MSPLYEYKCPKCGQTSEILQRATARMFMDCPNCGEIALRKPSTFSFPPIFRTLEAKKGGYRNVPDPELKKTVHPGVDIP